MSCISLWPAGSVLSSDRLVRNPLARLNELDFCPVELTGMCEVLPVGDLRPVKLAKPVD